MQQKMYDTGAARRLRPLKSVNTVESQAALGRGDTEEMLVEDMTEPQFACTQTDEDTLFESLTEDPGPASDMFLEELDGPLLSSNPSQERFERVLDDEEILLLDDEEILLDEYGDSDEEITLLGDEEFDWWHGFDGSIPANDDENINLIEQLVNPVWGDHQVSFTPHDGKGTEVSDDELLGFSDTEDDNLLRSQEELLEVLPINHAASSHQERMRI